MKGLQGKNALITGASSGIGRAIAVRLAQEGVNVGINYPGEPQGAEETQALLKDAPSLTGEGKTQVKSVLLKADVSSEAEVKAMFDTFRKEVGEVDILVNNAGMMIMSDKETLNSVEEFETLMNIDLKGSYICAKEFIESRLAQNKPGVIVNISSVHEVIPHITCVPYAMSKAGMGGMTRTLALKFAHKGIRVNGIGPGAINTPINEDWMKIPEEKKKIEDSIPMLRVGEPEEIASLTAFLASDEASYITGQTYYADGGMTLFAEFRETS